MNYFEKQERQNKAMKRIRALIDKMAPYLAAAWTYSEGGDGNGEAIFDYLECKAREQGVSRSVPRASDSQRPASTGIRMQAFKRDGYACVKCGSPDNLRAARIAAARGRRVHSVDDVMTVCHNHVGWAHGRAAAQ